MGIDEFVVDKCVCVDVCMKFAFNNSLDTGLEHLVTSDLLMSCEAFVAEH